nr:ABC transporter transmembrane domain-containing protein [uncultured Undibacterium sp.]
MNPKQTKPINQHLQRLSVLKPFRTRLLLGLAVMCITIVIELAYPKALAYFIDHLNSAKIDSSWIKNFAGIAAIVMVIQALATTLRYYIFESTGDMIVTTIRQTLFSALIRQDIAYFDKHRVGELTNRLASDVEALHDTLTMGLAISLRSSLVFIGCTAMLISISPTLSLILLIYIPLSLWMTDWIGNSLKTSAHHIQEKKAASNSVAQEYFSNIRLIHAFNQNKLANDKYADTADQALQVILRNIRLLASYRGISSIVLYLALIITFFLAADLISQGKLTVGEFTSFIIYAGMASGSSSAISDFWSDWMRTLGATERVFEILGADDVKQAALKKNSHAIPNDGVSTKNSFHLQGKIQFNNVHFAYPERPDTAALTALNFEIQSGEKIALIGASGAGKSSIASLLLGLYPVNQGQIYFDNFFSNDSNINAIRDHIAIVEQEPALFSGSIYENIAFAIADREVALEEVIQAATKANAHHFISGFPNGYDTVVGDRGVQLSGGQKQRIAIARAILRNPKILILDEATSALDSASEALVQAALDELMKERTTIIIAHRYSTIKKVDTVFVLEQGHIVQQGQHQDLIKDSKGLYCQLMSAQISGNHT